MQKVSLCDEFNFCDEKTRHLATRSPMVLESDILRQKLCRHKSIVAKEELPYLLAQPKIHFLSTLIIHFHTKEKPIVF